MTYAALVDFSCCIATAQHCGSLQYCLADRGAKCALDAGCCVNVLMVLTTQLFTARLFILRGHAWVPSSSLSRGPALIDARKGWLQTSCWKGCMTWHCQTWPSSRYRATSAFSHLASLDYSAIRPPSSSMTRLRLSPRRHMPLILSAGCRRPHLKNIAARQRKPAPAVTLQSREYRHPPQRGQRHPRAKSSARQSRIGAAVLTGPAE